MSVKSLCDARGWSDAKVRRHLDRAGVPVSRGMVDAEAAALALDAKGPVATADEKRYLECELLKLELRKASGKLVDAEETLAAITRRDAEIAGRINTWREASAAKRPEHAVEIEDLAASLHAMLAEPVVLQ